MGVLSKEQIRELIKEKQLVTAQDVQEMLKEMFVDTLQEMLEAELDTELGYPKMGGVRRPAAIAGMDTRRKTCVRSMENWNWRFHVTGRASSSRQW